MARYVRSVGWFNKISGICVFGVETVSTRRCSDQRYSIAMGWQYNDDVVESDNIEALERFLLDNPDLDKLEGLLSQFNIFETLKIVQAEVRHSNVLAWLLDPLSNHGVNTYFLKQLLKVFVTENKSNLAKTLTIFDIEMFSFGDVEIRREWKNIDVLIIIREESKKLVLSIENKVKSIEHSNQLQRYREIVEKEFSDFEKVYMYLTPDSFPPSDDNWLCFNYTDISNIIDGLLKYRKDSLNEMVEEFISQYNTILRRYIVGNSEVEQICQDIYKKHKTALDLIFQYKTDIELEISNYLQKAIGSDASLILDSAGKTVIRFTNEYFDSIIDKISEGWVKSKRMFLFEFVNYNKKLFVKLLIGPGDDEYRKKLFDICSKNSPLFKLTQRKTFGTKWQTVYQKRFLSEKDFDNAEMSDLSETIDSKWNELVNKDLPKIEEHFRKHWTQNN